ncbi:hypothetical protein [Siccibacter turicensis]|uniref:hypothetical protein n=2 Tax=Siccibacter turicensis TaxID=357233 RepID=UPI0004667416|nr:hypothetical protein [Siccibacter turicensis]
MNKVTCMFAFLLLTYAAPHIAYAEAATPVAEGATQPNIRTPVVESGRMKSGSEEVVSQSLQSQDISALNSLVNDQSKQILYMQKKIDNLENNSGLNFAVWTGILLTSVAVILTILGIVMALFSFLGYKKMIASAKIAAERISTKKASEVTERLAPSVTESVLLKLINEGNFDALIFDAVQKVTYRGTAFSSGDLLEENNKEITE